MTILRAERFPRIRDYQNPAPSKVVNDACQGVRQKILEAVEEAKAIDGRHGADMVATEAGCLCASLAAQLGGADGLKMHLDNVERDGSSQLSDHEPWHKPQLP